MNTAQCWHSATLTVNFVTAGFRSSLSCRSADRERFLFLSLLLCFFLSIFFSAKLLQFLLVRMPLGPVSVCSVAELLRHYQEPPRNSSLTRQRNRLFYLLLTPAGFCCYCEFSALNSRIKYKDIHTYLHTKKFLCCCSFCQRTLTETIIKPQ